jgi:uncharacterized protein YndB with AHSA1/START domain
MSSTQNSKVIQASPEALYRAFTNPEALTSWLVPGEMRGKVHHFDLSVGGGYQMSLCYPQTDNASHGKSAEKEDRYTARFVELAPPKRIVQAINFDTSDPAFMGEMIMEVVLEPESNGTRVTITFRNIPSGIRPEDNEAGTNSSLDKLAHYVKTGAEVSSAVRERTRD